MSRSVFISGPNAVSLSVFLPADMEKLLLSPRLACNSESIKMYSEMYSAISTQKKSKSPQHLHKLLTDSYCDYIQKSHFKCWVSPGSHSVWPRGKFSKLSKLKLNIFGPCVQKTLGYDFGCSLYHRTEGKRFMEVRIAVLTLLYRCSNISDVLCTSVPFYHHCSIYKEQKSTKVRQRLTD